MTLYNYIRVLLQMQFHNKLEYKYFCETFFFFDEYNNNNVNNNHNNIAPVYYNCHNFNGCSE